MGSSINNTTRNILVLFIVAIYLVVATSHIFLLKNTTQGDRQTHTHDNSIFKRKVDIFYSKVDDTSLIRLVDKTTVEYKKTANDFIKLTANSFVIILFFLAVWRLNPQPFNISRRQSINHSPPYLSFCILRI